MKLLGIALFIISLLLLAAFDIFGVPGDDVRPWSFGVFVLFLAGLFLMSRNDA